MRLLLAVLTAWTAARVIVHDPLSLHALLALVTGIVIDVAIFSWRKA